MTAVLDRARDYSAPGAASVHPDAIELSRIDVNPNQPRRHFDEDGLADLARSIEAQGVLQPILVRPVGARYEIVFGERRYRASLMAGKTTIPAMVKAVSEVELPVVAALENLQRSDLNRFEEVRAKVHLLATVLGLSADDVPGHMKRLRSQPDEHADDVLVVEQLFAQLGGEQWRSFVVNGLPVLTLPEVIRREVERGALAYSKAIVIARVPAEHQSGLVQDTIELRLSQAELHARIRALAPLPAADTLATVKRRLSQRRLSQLSPDQKVEAERLIEALHRLLT
ncbi:ParB/RepB/Spo0J family partition protein [Deinococcus sedimenti]|uniref:Plasmid-partitioning protein ParB n=1 Tax=Deinococcus sedimenti TaxID=1867090 RepID=A0ABQ2S6T6_9DEIO|nr:ParB/RepB/Spo0J family partition protein [Deinococcus sedimenti]GGS03343.1 putative plasmid-partitioning protein ParB [Deinococcus sedimenti]